jgi:hypothetical protein
MLITHIAHKHLNRAVYEKGGDGGASKAQAKAQQQAIDLQREQWNTVMNNLKPYAEVGLPALQQLQGLMTLEGQNKAANDFFGSGLYKTQADQARYQNLVSAEATGGLGSTATSNQLSSIAPMLYNNWLSGQMQNYGNLLNVGMNAASGQATAGQNYANNTGQLLQGLGAIRAGQAQQPSSLARGIGGAASGALAGAQLGSVVPGIGNVAGAIGDGLDLIKRVNNCDTTEAALLAADVLGIDYRTTETPEATSQKREQLETERQRREQERLKRAEKDEQQRRDTFSRQFDDMRRKAVNGKSDYLVAKGVGDFTFPVLPDGSLLLALVDKSGAVTAAQTITSHGEKRLLTGSAKRGAYHAINAPETTQSILIAEGLATALSAHLIRPEALTVAAIDAGNLLYVAQVLRDKFPSAQIIIAADNDHSEE